MGSLAKQSATASAVSLDEIRSYWDRQPCNIKHSPRRVGTKEYFDEVEARRYLVEPHIPRFAQFERWAGKRVLEIGCGIATDGVNFARAGALYTAVDLSPASLQIAKRRFAVYGLKGRFLEGNAERLGEIVGAGGFDLIYSFGVIHCTPDQRAVVAEARKLIAAEGELRIMVYARNSWKAIMIEAGLDQPEAQGGCPLATLYTPEMVGELFAGLFALAAIEQTHIFPYAIEPYRRHEYVLEPWFAAMPQEMLKALSRRLGWHYLIVGRPI